MSYFKTHYKLILMAVLPSLAYNMYFIFFMPSGRLSYLIYLDFLLAVCMVYFFISDIIQYARIQNCKEGLLKQDYIVYQEIKQLPELQKYMSASGSMDGVETDIAEHDALILNGQLKEQFDINCDLQDFIAKWCHEVKIPLSASLLIAEEIEDTELKDSLLEQLERMNMQLKSALLGTKMQSSLFDLQISRTSLLKCVKESIHNNQFFLVRKRFELDIQIGDENVYTDSLWLVYVLDQLISNSIKYAGENPRLNIYAGSKDGAVMLCVEDNGEGIKQSDIRRIFEKGYIGSNYHNGQYKSTGMGLYMAAEVLKKLEHEIAVESEYGKGTKFTITFRDNREYFGFD
ncbi:MAG: ATP-binding protein [Clostridiales bacterium]|nr:ATP-binding protein [Clostridiales bacterium]